MLQARIDGEVSAAESIILDEHLVTCRSCSVLLRQHQSTSAMMFEAFSADRLQHKLRGSVMENLPEMEPLRIDVQGVNWREKTPKDRRVWWAAWAPAVAAAMVLFLAVPLYFSWPKTVARVGAIVGLVTQSLGSVTCMDREGVAPDLSAVESPIACGNRYETAPNSKLLLTLRGPTHVKVDENTRLRVCDDRELSLESGHIFLDVAKDEARQFHVTTPAGSITVLGTIFDVLVNAVGTTVTLKTGKIRIDNGTIIGEVAPGEQVAFEANGRTLSRSTVNVDSVMRWAEVIVPEQSAYNLFAKTIQPTSTEELPAEEVYAVIANKDVVSRPISAFFLSWEPDGVTSGHCSYDVHVYNNSMVELFRDRIDGRLFADKTQRIYEVNVPGEPIRNTNVIHVKLVPDFSTGDVKTSFVKVWALGI